jgi:sugar O-acyltransferase (sialic acid O-acetyltransferase NeuD family)
MKPVIIFGVGQFAEVAHFYFTRDSSREVAAFTTDDMAMAPQQLLGLPVIPFSEIAAKYPPSSYDMFVAIGSSAVNRNRRDKCACMKSLGFTLASYASSKSIIWTEAIGENSFILEHNTIQPYTRIGNNVIIWSGNHIGHHVIVEDNCFITSHVVISGGVTIGEGTFLGVNATIRDHIHLGKYNVIGAGAVILKNTQDEEVYSSKSALRHPATTHEQDEISA